MKSKSNFFFNVSCSLAIDAIFLLEMKRLERKRYGRYLRQRIYLVPAVLSPYITPDTMGNLDQYRSPKCPSNPEAISANTKVRNVHTLYNADRLPPSSVSISRVALGSEGFLEMCS